MTEKTTTKSAAKTNTATRGSGKKSARRRSAVDLQKLTGRALAVKAPPSPKVDAGRVGVNKAYKMYVGGAFVRSESGRYVQQSAKARHGVDPLTVNVPRASRKDVRDAVRAALGAQKGWAGRTAFNRTQILYRLAEMIEARSIEFEAALVRGGLSAEAARREVFAAIDRTVFYAGFADKYQAIVASSNPVGGPHFNFSVPEPMGIVGVIAPGRPALLGLMSTVLPVVTGGNVCIALASEADPRVALLLCECLGTCDLPGGVINVLTGHASEVGPIMAKHREISALDAWHDDGNFLQELQREGADNVKRTHVHRDAAVLDWYAEREGQGLTWVERFIETKTVWHPVGL